MTATQTPHETHTGPEFERAEARTAHNYHPLPVVVAHAEGAWMTDVDGHRFLDLLAGYSALNFGHGHPALLAAAHTQLDQLTLTSRAFVHDKFADFTAALGDLCGKDMVLPMNTGAEAVETAIKVSRKWGYEVKGVPADQARIIVASGNFHGRTTTIVGFSDDPDARDGFGPFTPGFVTVPYGDALDLVGPLAGHLDRGLDRLGARVHRQHHVLAREGCERCDERTERRGVERAARQRDAVELRLGCGDEPRMPVPEVDGRVGGEAVEVAAAVDVGHPRARRVLDDDGQRVVVVRRVGLDLRDRRGRARVGRCGAHRRSSSVQHFTPPPPSRSSERSTPIGL